MILGIGNILGGLVLAEPLLANISGFKPAAERLRALSAPYRSTLGVIELVLGGATFIDRIDLVHIPILDGGFPQIVLSLAMGLLLANEVVKKYPFLKSLIESIQPYQEYIGLAGLLVGLYALL